MPNLNNFFRRFREHKAEREKQKKSLQAPTPIDPLPLNLYSSSGMSSGGIAGCCSRKTSSTMSRENHPLSRLHLPCRKASSASTGKFCPFAEQIFPNAVLFRIFDSIESPFDFLRLRRLNKSIMEYAQSKVNHVVEMDLRRVRFETLSSSSTGSNLSNQLETSIIIEGEVWHVHPNGCKVLCRFRTIEEQPSKCNSGIPKNDESSGSNLQHRLEVIVDEEWTSREIFVLCSLVNEFRHVRRINLDAPIFELIVANLAAVDLDRWFAYQCFVKAIDGGQMNAELNKLAAQLQQDELMDPYSDSDPDKLYWPNAKIIQIRTTERESITLARVLNYGVRSNLIMDRQRLDQLSLQICVKDANEERPKQLVRNLYHFRCWAGSLGFDERFSQHWRAGSKVA